jgi:predicted enzyme related to lactoylglutathione lyase
LKKLFAFAPAVLLAGCAAVTPNLPAITESPTVDEANGRIVWHDLLTTTPAESRTFYAELFGWEFERPAMAVGVGDDDSYMLIRHNGELIGGMLDARVLKREQNISQWITVMSVDDIEAAVNRVATNDGEVMTPPTDVGARGKLAVIAGPDKGIIALLQARDGLPGHRKPVTNGWLWNELWTDDVDRATRFYQELAGFEVADEDVPGTDNKYRMLKSGDELRVGILPNPFEGELPVWVNYLRVDDPAAITARVEALGGRVIADAQKRPIGGKVAFIAGPSGAGIALQTWPLDQEVAE